VAAHAKLMAAWPDGKLGVARHVDERGRVGETKRWAVAADRLPQERRGHIRGQIGERDVEKDRRSPPAERCEGSDHEPDRALRPDARESDEHVVEHADTVMDDPALESRIEVQGAACGAASGCRAQPGIRRK